MSSVRIDIWLWAARFFKTRALAKRACELGRIESNGQPAKPAREVRVGRPAASDYGGRRLSGGGSAIEYSAWPGCGFARELYFETEGQP